MKPTKEQIKYYINYDIIGTSDISDTIISYYENNKNIYKNVNTGLDGHLFKDVICAGRKYIYLNLGDNKKISYRGFIAKYFEEEDSLLVSFLSFNNDTFKWQEKFRLLFWKYSKTSCVANDLDYLYLSLNGGTLRMDESFLKDFYTAYDLGGQLIHKNFVTPDGINISSYSWNEIFKFTGGGFYDGDNHFPWVTNCCNLPFLVHFIFTNNPYFGLGTKNKYMNSHIETKNIPDDLTAFIEQSAITIYNNNIYSWSQFVNGFLFGYLQKYKDSYIYRTFRCFVSGMPENGALPLRYIETRRIFLSPECINQINDVCIAILCYDKDGIEKSPFKYAIKYIDDSIQKNKKDLLSRNGDWGYFTDHHIIGSVCAIAYCPVYETLLNLFRRDGKDDWNYTELLELPKRGGNIICHIQELYGDINIDEKPAHKILGISKSVLDIFRNGYYQSYTLTTLKEAFKNEKDYLMNMDNKTAKTFLNCIDDEGLWFDNTFAKCMQILIRIYGVKNSSRYMFFLLDEYGNTDDQIHEYYEYIKKVDIINGCTNLPLRWKIKYHDIEKAEKSINDTYKLINDEKFYKEASDSFKKQAENWQQYEYSDNEFLVTYPKGPTDLIEEGFKLNHCVKQFMDNVTSGISTILFIRKTNEPEVPFFTLELRGDTARQCHGFNNCNVSSCDGLMEFLNDFCKEKNIKIDENINKLYGIDEV